MTTTPNPPASVPAATPVVPQRSLADFLPGDKYSQYLLTGKNEMFAVCRGLVDHVSLISMIFNAGRDMVLTTLISYGENGLILDFGASEENNLAALKADKLFCAAQLDKVEIQFILRGAKRVVVDGRPAFHAPLPDSILRLQRREYFRLLTPIVTPLRCKIRSTDADGVPLSLNAQLADISVGGVCLSGLPASLPLDTGTQFVDASIDLPEGGSVVATLQLRWLIDVVNRSGIASKRAGFEFVRLPHAKSTLIQRYITKIERDRKARESGQL
ncbi:MAG: flagellar brake protein [Rhodocyclales bacterium]|nr:flagellar brake protein [Rhodocyclales bacterium]